MTAAPHALICQFHYKTKIHFKNETTSTSGTDTKHGTLRDPPTEPINLAVRLKPVRNLLSSHTTRCWKYGRLRRDPPNHWRSACGALQFVTRRCRASGAYGV